MTSRMAKAGWAGAALLILPLIGCGGAKSGNAEAAPPADQDAATSDGNGLTAFQMENGIGPITEVVKVGTIDEEKAEEGEKIFTEKCSACHKMAERYVGPALGEVTVRRTPTYVMNMILAPDQMYGKHPTARQLLAEYMTPMPNLGLTQDQARSILEYLRTQAPGSEKHD
ncbi:MAG TPA: cytochrome c [Gemmatimonadales bacterium]|nr:cytochrome c [Gemmatimonadales bacterium]